MMWSLEFSSSVLKDLRKIPKGDQERILKYLQKIAQLSSPRDCGKPLKGKKELWRYRVGDYRMICTLEDKQCTILVLVVRHRKNVYQGIT